MVTDLEQRFSEHLNTHGFGFHYAVLKEANHLSNQKISPWCFEGAEFPVEVNGKSTHIDFILRNKHERFYLIAECKRANPALSNWCFAKTPYTHRKATDGSERIVRELFSGLTDRISIPRSTLECVGMSKNVYRLAFEIKSREKGEGQSGRGQINEAISQVLRGMNGLIQCCAEKYRSGNDSLFSPKEDGNICAAFLPVIFTTAKLFVSDVDLSSADIDNGNIDSTNIKLEEKNWILYQYSQSPDLKHNIISLNEYHTLSDILYFDYTRTIPIVNSKGIKEFLEAEYWKDINDWKNVLL